MKIGVIHPSFEVVGGAEQTTYSILRALKNTHHNVTLYTTTKNPEIPPEIKICHIQRNSFPIGWSLQRILDTKKLFSKAKNEDILFISSGNLILTDTKKNVIIYCHSTFESELKKLEKIKSGFTKLYYKYIQKQIKFQLELLKKSSVKLIANSNYTKEKIKEIFGKDSTVIYPPVKINKKNNQKNGIITIARYSKEKKLEFNLHVIKNFKIQYKVFGNARFPSQLNYYNSLKKIILNHEHIELYLNSERDEIEKNLNSSKVYFQSSEETFGISVVEGILAGCIPIVPDNSANKETVPFDELRYVENDENDAGGKIELAINGDFDKFLIKLQDHAKRFSEENFQKNVINYLSKFE
ncbi:alpha-12-mannosyltransferase protein [Marine Group I thaumarchaeote SCGC RSA3]|uniref:Alpha-12-mannosyltransferase protein n=2 Tax=Marine Group I TaxID=905826 RepID=A0A087RM33_9ARCH|nr:alpha-12-mannosyltransferase protein [Marine Group I thaumarchaeote SCGC AAA799-D11]KFM19931.1 alpha-12-mannosyltransferase protein [Marine Group I thaumarchaeote SCGC RSA3]